MRALLIVSASLLLAMAAGNASALCRKNTNFPMIDKGMTLDEVTKLIGKPVLLPRLAEPAIQGHRQAVGLDG